MVGPALFGRVAARGGHIVRCIESIVRCVRWSPPPLARNGFGLRAAVFTTAAGNRNSDSAFGAHRRGWTSRVRTEQIWRGGSPRVGYSGRRCGQNSTDSIRRTRLLADSGSQASAWEPGDLRRLAGKQTFPSWSLRTRGACPDGMGERCLADVRAPTVIESLIAVPMSCRPFPTWL